MIFAAVAIHFSATDALADCPDFGIENTDEQAEFCAELEAIRSAPEGDEKARQFSLGGDEDSVSEDLLKHFPDLADAHRSDPQRTLELIKRIRDAGGLRAE